MAEEWVLAWLTGVARQCWTHSLFSAEWVLLLLCWTSLITMQRGWLLFSVVIIC